MPPHALAASAVTRSRWFTYVTKVCAALGIAVAAYMVGPRYPAGEAIPTVREQAPTDLSALDAWIAKQEAAFPAIKSGTAKEIVWADKAGQKTPWSIIYLHGFSASRLETAPLTEKVAKALGANVFYTRLQGHGLPGAAMGEARMQDWLADAVEALRIGQLLGERVLVISCSTGATLATWLGTQSSLGRMAGHVFISPNFGPKDGRADLMNGPWGPQIAHAVLGSDRHWTPASAAESNAWSTSYPTQSLFPMMALVKVVREGPLETFRSPVLVLYSPADETVDPDQTRAAFERLGSAVKQLEPVGYSEAKGQHVLAGDIKAPRATEPMVHTIATWALSLPQVGPP
ncbi:MAG: YqiA/YcfP family alpha/beta fold hydrolase [Rhodoferax sp.]|nr:YqiA/YcfP family alpha/beta fold hydrolase [Rhodoferax sp.]